MSRAIVAVLLLCPVGCSESGPKLYPVRGTVTVNGKPAQFVRVQFRHTNQELPGNLKSPVSVTDASGAFELSTSGDRDGAHEGDYTVTFEWLSGNDLGAYDRFGGRFAKPDASARKVRVDPKTNELPPFDLTIPEAALINRPVRPQ